MVNRWSDAKKQKFKALWGAGVSVRDIAVQLGASETSVKKMRITLNFPRRNDKIGAGSREVSVRFSAAQYAAMERCAEAQGHTIAHLVRHAVDIMVASYTA